MSKTKSAAAITAPEALAMLSSALSYCHQAGLVVRMINTPNLVLSVEGAIIQDGRIVAADVTILSPLTPEVTAPAEVDAWRVTV